MAQSQELEIEARPEVEELSPRLSVVDEFLAYRWQHEKNRGTHLASLGDPSFIPRLVAMAGSGFWRGEYGDQIAATLNAIGDADNVAVVDALLRLAAYSGTGFQGLAAIGDFARRCNNEVKVQFVNELSTRTIGADEVHILVGLGEPGIEAVVREYKRLEKGAPMRRQIESYLVVRPRLGLS